MRLQELIRQTLWEHVEAKLADAYPDTQDRLGQYRELFHALRDFDTAPTDYVLCIDKVYEEDQKEFWYDIYGQTQDGQQWAIEFTPWQQWMEMHVGLETQNDPEMSSESIVAHSLWEMTYAGMNQEQIQELLEALQEVIREEKENVSHDEKSDD